MRGGSALGQAIKVKEKRYHRGTHYAACNFSPLSFSKRSDHTTVAVHSVAKELGKVKAE